jgi:3-oxoacyl-(acyl-carrier-protein) synthase
MITPFDPDRSAAVRRVVVTGLGVVCPDGASGDVFWNVLWGQVPPHVEATPASPSSSGDGKRTRTMGRITRLAVEACGRATADACLQLDDPAGDELGVFFGTNMDDFNLLGVCRAFEPGPHLGRFAAAAAKQIHPFDYFQSLSNMPAAHVAVRWQARGMNCSYYTHGISGLQAVGEAYLAVRDGVVHCALAGGADSWLTPFAAWRRGVFPHARFPDNGIPPTAPRGGCLAEGAAALVLEPLESALARGVPLYGEVTGYASALDASAFPGAAPATAAVRAVRLALSRAHLASEDIDYLALHDDGSGDSDRIETDLLREVWPAGPPAVQGLKRVTGHLGAASGAVEAASTLLAIHRQCMPAVAGGAGRIGAALNLALHPLGLFAAVVFRRVSRTNEALGCPP